MSYDKSILIIHNADVKKKLSTHTSTNTLQYKTDLTYTLTILFIKSNKLLLLYLKLSLH